MAFRRRKIFKRRRFTKRRFMFKRFAKKVYKAVKSRAEKKEYTVSSGPDNVSISGNLYPLNTMTQGTGDGQRIGNKVDQRYIKLRIWMDATAAVLTTTTMRVCIVRGRSAGFSIADCPTSSLVNFWDKDKWEVIKDMSRVMGSSSTDGRDEWIINTTVKAFKPIQYNDNISTPVTNPYYLFVRSNDNATPYPTVTFSALVTFTDL